MKGFAVLCLLLLAKDVSSVEIEIYTMDGTISEGEDMVVRCRISTPDPTRSIVTRLFAEATSIAENGFDAEPAENYLCVIPPGDLTGSVSIPTFIDNVFDDGEVFVIGGIPLDPADTSVMMAPFALTDVASGFGDEITIRPRERVYQGHEGENITIMIEFYDDVGQMVPFEIDYTLGFRFIDQSATGGMTNAPPDDYDNTDAGGLELMGSVEGVGTVSAVITIPLVDDGLPENIETFAFTLVDAGVPGVIVDEDIVYTIIIIDIDKPGVYLLNENTLLPRRSKKTVKMVAFTENSNNGFDLRMAPRMTDYRQRSLDGYNGDEFWFPRPDIRSRSRFTEYRFSTTELTNGKPFFHQLFTHISATSHKRRRAPINTWMGTTITAYPKADSDRLQTPVTIAVEPQNLRFRRDLRWEFYGETGVVKPLKNSKGDPRLKLTLQSEAGLYVIYRFKRRDTGWVQYVRVILSECPRGMYHSDSWCDGGPVMCQHGGVVDPEYSEGLCTCPPGYFGNRCEIPGHITQFGNNGQFDARDFFDGNGRGITFIFKSPFGSTCASGFYGPSCSRNCRAGYFGPGCAFSCNCVDDYCSRTGVCLNGCAAGYSGATCQNIA